MPLTLVVALIFLAGVLLAPGLWIGPSLDAAVFSHVGGRLLDGVAPYVGAWDHKPPGIYIASAAARLLLGWLGPWTADWLISVGTTAGVGIAIVTALTRLGVSSWQRALAAIGATIIASQYLFALGGGLTEAPATLLVAWALVLALGPASGWRAVAIGAFIAMSLLLSIQLLPGGAVVLLLALVVRPGPERLRAGIAMAVAFIIPLAIVAAWLTAIGALSAAIDAVLTYSTAYRGSSGQYGAILAAPVAAWTVLASLFLVAPALLGLPSAVRGPTPARAVVIGSLLWIGLSLSLFVFQGRFHAHYAIPLVVPLGILAGLGLKRVAESLGRTQGSGARAVIVLPFAVTLVVSLFAGVLSGAMVAAPIAEESARMRAAAERLDDFAAGSLLVWGNEPRLYELSGRAPATRYSYLYPLTTPGYSTAGMIDEVALELAAHPPQVVVDAGSSAPGEAGFLPLLIDRPVASDGRDLDLLNPLRSFVLRRYELAATVAGWPIYVLRSDEVGAIE